MDLNTKGIVSVILTITMLLTTLSISIFAEEEAELITEEIMEIYDDSEMELFTQDRSKYFNKDYKLTGVPAKDIVIVANAQLNVNLESKYSEAWCADFVTDCARLTGMDEKIIPYNYAGRGACRLLISYMTEKCDAVEVTSPKEGDLVFYYCATCTDNHYPHVGIVMNSTHSIEGNYSDKVSKVSLTSKFKDQYGHSCKRVYIRPNYPEDVAPAQPEIKSFVTESSSSITITWGKVANATKYRVDRRLAVDGAEYEIVSSSVTGTSYTDKGLEAGRRYFYRVYAISAAGNISEKSVVFAASTKPEKPDIIEINVDGTTQISLKWGAVPYATRYKITYRRGDEDVNDYKTLTSDWTGTSYVAKNLTPGSRYLFRVYAIKDVETGSEGDGEKTIESIESEQSEVQGAFTWMNRPKITVQSGAVTLAWDKSNGASTYKYAIYRKEPYEGTLTKIATTDTLSYTDMNLEKKAYQYQIVTVTPDSESVCTATDVFYAGPYWWAPTVKTVGENTINISWNGIEGDGYFIYQIYRKLPTDADFAGKMIGETNEKNFTDNGLTENSTYQYRIVVVDENKNIVTESDVVENTTWDYVSIGDNFTAYITQASTGMNITQDNNSNVTIRSKNGLNNQLWNFKLQYDGSYKVVSLMNGKLLDVYDGLDIAGTNVAACDDNGGANQRWYLINKNGNYLLKPMSGNCMLDVAGGNVLPVAEGTNIQVYPENGTGGQLFCIDVTSEIINPTIAVTRVELNKQNLTLNTGDTDTLTATVKPDDATDKTVIWSSSDKTVATVENGVITAISAGEAVITATVGGKSATCAVTVKEKEVIDEEAPKLYITEASAKKGDTVTVDIVLENNTGFANLEIEVDYDETVLTLTDVSGNTGVGATFTKAPSNDTKPYNMSWTSMENVYYNGTIATLTFKVSGDAKDGKHEITLSYYKGVNGDYTDGYDVNIDEDFNAVGFVYQSGVINITSHIPGDINGDGVVNSRDSITLLRHLAGWDVEVVENAIDVNGDGAVNSRDSITLLRYLAGWEVEIY